MPNESISIDPVTAAIGARVSGVDLRRPLPDETFAQIRRALATHQVLFFRDQDLSEDQHRAFAARFGTLGVDAMARLTGNRRDMIYPEDTADSPPGAADRWHTDISWVAEPPALGILNARVIPAFGGDTLWASLFALYDALSPSLRSICEQMSVVHHPTPGFVKAATRAVGADFAARVEAEFPPIEHPLVRTHPVSGRPALFLATTMNHIVGLHRRESDMLLAYLRSLIDEPGVQVRWTWRPFDLVVWDQASTNHRALGDHYPQHRKMRRCTIEGGRPFFRRGEGGI